MVASAGGPGALRPLLAFELGGLAKPPPAGPIGLPAPSHARLVVELALSHVGHDAFANAFALEAPEGLLEGSLVRNPNTHGNPHPLVGDRPWGQVASRLAVQGDGTAVHFACRTARKRRSRLVVKR